MRSLVPASLGSGLSLLLLPYCTVCQELEGAYAQVIKLKPNTSNHVQYLNLHVIAVGIVEAELSHPPNADHIKFGCTTCVQSTCLCKGDLPFASSAMSLSGLEANHWASMSQSS